MRLRHNIFNLFLSLTAIVLAVACTDDLPDSGVTGAEGSDHSAGRFSLQVKIRTAGNPASRADDGDLVDGSKNEQLIGTVGNFIIFFDENDKFHSVEILTLDTVATDPSLDDVVEKSYTTVLDPDAFEELPAGCLVVLNGLRFLDRLRTYTTDNTLADVQEMFWSDVENPLRIGRVDSLFTMTNSTYYNDKGKLTTVVPIDGESMIYNTKDPSSKAKAIPLVVYVERMVAKMTFEVDKKAETNGEYLYTPTAQQLIFFKDFTGKDASPVYEARDWKVAVTGWDVNGLEPQSYLFKKITQGKEYFSNWAWRAPDEYRVFWAEDFNYDGIYPWQYRQSVNVLNVPYYEQNPAANVLRNYSFNDLAISDRMFAKSIYVPENTYDYKNIKALHDGRADLLAGTHVIIGAELRLKGKDGTYVTPKHIYRDREGFYYDSDTACFQNAVYGLNSALKSQRRMKFVYYDWSGKNPELHGKVYYAKSQGGYELYLGENPVYGLKFQGDTLALATIKNGDGKRLPWLKKGNFRIWNGTDSIKIVSITVNEKNEEVETEVENYSQDFVKSILFEWIGAFDHFRDGKMYYAAPAVLQHVNKSDFDTDSDTDSDDICGVVRNNWYHFRLVNVNGLGTPVDDPNQPIIPDPVSHYDQINVTIKIIPWHVYYTYAPIL